jgi:glycine/D-amino acid oxidase-like deaminating enzyme
VKRLAPISETPQRDHYDVVIVGGAVIGSSVASFLSADDAFDGSVLVVEKDPTYEFASTTHTNSCMRQQFSNPLNIQVSRFAAEFVADFRQQMGGDPEIPDLFTQYYGYLYLAATEERADRLRRNQAIQAQHGAATRIMTPAEIKARWPFITVDDLVCGTHNPVDEGYFDSGTMFDWFRRRARENGVEYLRGEVVGIDRSPDGQGPIRGIRLASGHAVGCATVVNAAGPRAAGVAAMAGLDLPVEPRKRYTFVIDAAEPPGEVPLTLDPSGVHVRSDGDAYMTGCAPDPDPAVDPDDFEADRTIFEDKVWPVLAHRIPAFERIKVVAQWVGHYAHNTLDQNAIVGPHPELANFLFANGFSGHGMQQAPAIGRAVAELVVDGSYRTLDLSPLGYERIIAGQPFEETAVI